MELRAIQPSCYIYDRLVTILHIPRVVQQVVLVTGRGLNNTELMETKRVPSATIIYTLRTMTRSNRYHLCLGYSTWLFGHD